MDYKIERPRRKHCGAPSGVSCNINPAVKTFVGEVGRKNIICIPTSLGSKLKDRAEFAKVIDLVGDPIAPPPAPL